MTLISWWSRRLAELAGTCGVLAAALSARRAAHIDMLGAIATE